MWVKYCGKFFRGSFDSAKDEVRCKVAASNYSAPLIYPPPRQTGAYVVAWHLRVGDITIPRDKVSRTGRLCVCPWAVVCGSHPVGKTQLLASGRSCAPPHIESAKSSPT